MNTRTTLAIVPMLVALGVAATPAHGDETVKVRASILFNINGGVFGYQEPYYERVEQQVVIVERPVVVERTVVVREPVVYVRRVEPRPRVIVTHPRPVVVIRDEHRDCDRGRGRGNKKQHDWKKGHDRKNHYVGKETRVVVRNDDDRRGNVREAVRVERNNPMTRRR